MASNCLFCRIVSRQLPADIVAEDPQTLAFRDVNPQAPTHVLVVPKQHIASVAELTDANSASVMGAMTTMANRLAKQLGVVEGYRLVVNCGSQAGQSVWHLHLHVLGGREMRWPPG